MNCKQGDLAVFVRSMAGNDGLIVRCLRLADEHDKSNWGHERSIEQLWLVDKMVKKVGSETGRPFPAAPLAEDAFLRPIRDPGDDATDETLTWLPVPRKEIA